MSETVKNVKIHCNYRLVKDALFGYFYYQTGTTIVGRVEGNVPEEGFLYSTLSYLNDFFESFNDHDFTEYTIREIFDLANAQNLGEDVAFNMDLTNNLKVIPPTDLFDDYTGGIFKINSIHYFYCIRRNQILIEEPIDFILFKEDFMQLKLEIEKVKPNLIV